MNINEKINYLEFPARNIPKTKAFFTKVFDWEFFDYGPEYTVFSNEGIDGGFFKSDQQSLTSNGAALVIFYSDDLEKTLAKVQAAEGLIIQTIFPFSRWSSLPFYRTKR